MNAEMPYEFGGRVFQRREALAAGFSQKEVVWALRTGRWTRLRHGVYVDTAVHAASAGDLRDRHRLYVRAHLLQLGDGAVASHASAAYLHGMSVLRPPTLVAVTRPSATVRQRDELHVQRAPLSAEEVSADGHGVAVTSPARTVLDLARTASFRAAVVTADSALKLGLTSRQEIEEQLERVRPWRGARQAGRVVSAMDGRSESPGESLARLDLHALGYGHVVPQLPVVGASGRRYRGDLVLERERVIVEFDGLIKYHAEDEQKARLALTDEKEREDDLRASGWAFARLVWADLGRLSTMDRKMRAAFATRAA